MIKWKKVFQKRRFLILKSVGVKEEVRSVKKWLFSSFLLTFSLVLFFGCASSGADSRYGVPPYIDDNSEIYNGGGQGTVTPGTQTGETGGSDTDASQETSDVPTVPIPPVKPPIDPSLIPTLETFSGVTIEPVTATYDGKPKYPLLKGFPDDIDKTYDCDPTNVGTYTVVVTVTAEGYEPLTLSSTVEIVPAKMPLSFNSLTAYEDGKAHALSLTGDLPDGAEICYYEIGANGKTPVTEAALSRTEAGTYRFSVEVTCENHETFSAEAELKILPKEAGAVLGAVGDTVLYRNPLKENALYGKSATDTTDSEMKLTRDVIAAVFPTGENTFLGLCVSDSPFSLYAYTLENGQAIRSEKPLFEGNIDAILFFDAACFYCTVTVGETGIYKVSLSETEKVENRPILSGQYENLQFNGDKSKLFFTDSDNGGILCSIDLSADEPKVTQYDGLIFDSFLLLGDAVYGVFSDGTFRADPLSGEKEKIYDTVGSDFCVGDGKVFFLISENGADAENEIVAYDSETRSTGKDLVCGGELSSLFFFRDCLYILSSTDFSTELLTIPISSIPFSDG